MWQLVTNTESILSGTQLPYMLHVEHAVCGAIYAYGLTAHPLTI